MCETDKRMLKIAGNGCHGLDFGRWSSEGSILYAVDLSGFCDPLA